MELSVIVFALGLVGILASPRRWLPYWLLLCCCYPSVSGVVEIGPLSWPPYRLALAVGVLRLSVRREWPKWPLTWCDLLVGTWSAWVCLASVFHQWAPGSGPVYAAGFVFNTALAYLLVRAWCGTADDVWRFVAATGIVLVPIAIGMIGEQVRGANVFAAINGLPDTVYVRNGVIRSQGPFQHPILAGTVGAVCFPLMVGIWARRRGVAITGLGACTAIVLTSGSSGPLVSWAMGALGVALWQWRRHVWVLWILMLGLYLWLELVMTRPAYFFFSKIDLTGSSTGWHRARVIQAAIEDLPQWWLFGTDRTIHWTGVSLGASDRHADITNYYLWIGVVAGLPAILLMLAVLWRAFRYIGQLAAAGGPLSDRWAAWCLGCSLFAHAGTALSVAYFDQSTLYFWFTLALISSLQAVSPAARTAPTPTWARTRALELSQRSPGPSRPPRGSRWRVPSDASEVAHLSCRSRPWRRA